MKAHHLLASTALIGALLVQSLPLQAAPAATPADASSGKRPKICLVLSGGGARGAAHVGVIKVLEQYRIPIDCIAGTSMGSLVGAAYATGMSVPEMEDILTKINTASLMGDKAPRKELSMRRKRDDMLPLIGPELGVTDDGKISLTKGAISGVQLENVLRRLTKLSGYHRFDRLPIPFRAVATDLVSGKAVIFDRGDLINAMRASMSVPGVVAPAEFNDMMLVDGMLTSNLPIEIARKAFNPDIIIAVNVGTPLLKREDLTTILGVTGQMLSILTEQNVQASLATLKPVDILISPELGDYSTADFDNLIKISPLGETAALKVTDKLAALSMPSTSYASLREKQTTHVAPDMSPVEEIRIRGLARVNPEEVRSVMKTRENEAIDQDMLDGDMRRIYGTGDFSHVAYRFSDEQSKRVLAIEAVEKSWGPNYLRFGLGLSSDFDGAAYYNLLGSYRKTWINSLGAEWRTDLQLGNTTRLFSEFYQPLTASGEVFVAPYVNFERRQQNVYQGDERIAQYSYRDNYAGLDVGSQMRGYGEARLGVSSGLLYPELSTGSVDMLPQQHKINTGGARLQVIFDQLDSTIFPREGWSAVGQIYDSNASLGADIPYTKWSASGSYVHSFGNHTFNFYGKVGGRAGSNDIPAYDMFQWGGFMQQSGYATGQLLGQEITFGRMLYYHRVMHGSLFEGAYVGVSLETGKVGMQPIPASDERKDWLHSASIFVGADSPLGPAYLGYGRSSEGNHNIYFYLGRPY
jgi:NTE family protein